MFFNNPVPNPTIEITEIPRETEYVGLNYTLRCEAQVPGSQLNNIGTVIEWMKDGVKLSSSNDGRITLGETLVDSPGQEFRRSIMFSPLSAGDMGSYRCSGTIRPTVDNPGVTNGVGIRSSNLTVAGKFNNNLGSFSIITQCVFAHSVPTLEVSINRAGVSLRILDVSPFNGFPLTCVATSTVAGIPVSTRKRITWMRSIDGGPSEPLTNGANVDSVVMVMEDNLLQATSMSMLMVNTTMSGSHSYTCRAELVVAPAPEIINEQTETTISVAGEQTFIRIIFIIMSLTSLSYSITNYHVCYNYQGLPVLLNQRT